MHKSFDLARLESFLAVADAGGFSRAAGAAAATQPTLSRQVRQLEAALGRPLFRRFRGKIALTPFGQKFLGEARGLLARAEAISRSGKAPEGRASGVLHLGAADSVVLSRLPSLLRGFLRRHPEVSVHVHTASSPQILAWVREGRCDAGFCMLPETSPGLELRPLWEDSFVALVPLRHALANRSASLSIFSRERLLAIQPGTLSYQVLAAAYQRAGLLFVPDMTFDTFSLVVAFVAAGVGTGIASASVAGPALRRRQVARARIGEIDSLRRRLGVALHAGSAPEGPLAAFLSEIGLQKPRKVPG